MTIVLNDPNLERLIADHIQSGRFTTPTEVVIAALTNLPLDRPATDDEIDPIIAARLREAHLRGQRGDPGHSAAMAKEMLSRK